ncbi:hypothetical protein DAPPUDRAFT_99422 [Daphnia pulex]|uniref:Uncharacterized protein n=1 Tax=Daphnia pulex TaxID=6669 RepID=E9G839_DAPPU|nr:hypothetical protein DAPPUDRAFT_99422 [Daphnia pulex]|eukprot:EFX84347.1 hypothetical protein DAPPUDRAFT_99422 [Daphnia pulex]
MTSEKLSPDPQRIWAMSSIDPRVLDGERRSAARLNFTKTREEEEETGNVKRRRCRPASLVIRRAASHSDPSNTQSDRQRIGFLLFHGAKMSRCKAPSKLFGVWRCGSRNCRRPHAIK